MKLTEIKNIPDTVHELFTQHPEIWTRGKGAHGLYDENDCPVDEYHQASKMCVGSAIGFVVRKGEQYDGELHAFEIDRKADLLRLAVKRMNPDREFTTLVAWNDRPDCTVEEVIEACKEAGI